jgi:hypothetical protein
MDSGRSSRTLCSCISYFLHGHDSIIYVFEKLNKEVSSHMFAPRSNLVVATNKHQSCFSAVLNPTLIFRTDHHFRKIASLCPFFEDVSRSQSIGGREEQ